MMTGDELLEVVAGIVLAHVDDAALRLELADPARFTTETVIVHTRVPGKVIGRRGVTANLIRAEIAEAIGRPIGLFVAEIDDDDGGTPVRAPRPDEPPPDGLFAAELAVPEDLRSDTHR